VFEHGKSFKNQKILQMRIILNYSATIDAALTADPKNRGFMGLKGASSRQIYTKAKVALGMPSEDFASKCRSIEAGRAATLAALPQLRTAIVEKSQ
jgi:hypothetical protein